MLLVYISNHLISKIVFSQIRIWWYRKIMAIQLGRKTSVLTDFKLSQQGNLIVRNNTVNNNSCRFDNRFLIEIGDNVSISYGTHLLTKGHDMNSPDFSTKGAGIKLEDYA